MKRYGKVIRVKPEMLEEYKTYHANLWPEVRDALHANNIHNYSIYHRDGYLFSYSEYMGDDLKTDAAKLTPHPKAKEWNDLMRTMQVPVDSHTESEWWADMEEVFHLN